MVNILADNGYIIMGYDLFGSLEQSTAALWYDVMQFAPKLAIALLVLIVGWIIGGITAGLIKKGFRALKLDAALDKAGVDDLSARAGYTFKPTQFIGSLVKWFIVLVFAVVAFDILGLNQVTVFAREVVLGYLPQVFAAALILFIGVLVAQLAKDLLMGVLRGAGSKSVELYGKVAYALVITFTIMAVLNQLQIADELVEILFMGIVFALSLGSGLAFGLGGRDAAGRYIDKVTKQND
jgi:hypothetical protein